MSIGTCPFQGHDVITDIFYIIYVTSYIIYSSYVHTQKVYPLYYFTGFFYKLPNSAHKWSIINSIYFGRRPIFYNMVRTSHGTLVEILSVRLLPLYREILWVKSTHDCKDKYFRYHQYTWLQIAQTRVGRKAAYTTRRLMFTDKFLTTSLRSLLADTA